MLRDDSPRNTPAGDPSGGVIYLRIVLSPEESSRLWVFLNISFNREGLLAPRPNPKLEDHPSSAVRECYSIYSQLPLLSEAVPLSPTWGRAIPWWQGPTNTVQLPTATNKYGIWGVKVKSKYCGKFIGRNTNPPFTCLLHTSVNLGVNVAIFTLNKTRFKLSALSPENSLDFNSGSYKIPNKIQQKLKKTHNDKPNSFKHVRHIVPKRQEIQSFYQTVSNACQFNSTTVCPG